MFNYLTTNDFPRIEPFGLHLNIFIKSIEKQPRTAEFWAPKGHCILGHHYWFHHGVPLKYWLRLLTSCFQCSLFQWAWVTHWRSKKIVLSKYAPQTRALLLVCLHFLSIHDLTRKYFPKKLGHILHLILQMMNTRFQKAFWWTEILCNWALSPTLFPANTHTHIFYTSLPFPHFFPTLQPNWFLTIQQGMEDK